jgi:hypothetical protein
VLEERHDLIPWHEAVRIGPVVGVARRLDRPVRGHQAEAVPSVTPGLADLATLEHDMLHAVSGELVARGQTRLAAPNDEVIAQGEVWWAAIGDPAGSEPGRTRRLNVPREPARRRP